jgi:hypothetical protein
MGKLCADENPKFAGKVVNSSWVETEIRRTEHDDWRGRGGVSAVEAGRGRLGRRRLGKPRKKQPSKSTQQLLLLLVATEIHYDHAGFY